MIGSGLSLAAAGAAAKTVVTIGTWFTDSEFAQKYGPQMEALRQANPDIDLKTYKIADHGTFATKIFLLANSGDLPDILLVPPEQVAPLVGAGLLTDLDPLIAGDKSLDTSTWLPGAVNAVHFNGIMFGLPAYVVNYTYAYNTQILAERGVAAPAHDAWLTWDQVEEIGKKTTIDKNGDGTTDVWGYNHRLGYDWMLPPIFQAGGEVFGEKRLLQFDTAPVRQASDWLVQLIKEGVQPPPGVSASFAQGSIATQWMGSWEMAGLIGAKTPIDTTSGEQDKTKDEVAYVTSWAMPKTAKHPQAAWTVLKWLDSPESQSYVVQQGLVPMRRDVELPYATRSVLTGLINALTYARSYPYHIFSDYITQEVNKAMADVWSLKKTPEQVLPELQRTINAYLSDQFAKAQ